MDTDSDQELEDLKRELKANEARRRAELLKSAIAALMIGVAALVLSFYQVSNIFDRKGVRTDTTTIEINSLRSELNLVRDRANEISKIVEAISEPVPSSSITVEQRKLASAITVVDARLTRIGQLFSIAQKEHFQYPSLEKMLTKRPSVSKSIEN